MVGQFGFAAQTAVGGIVSFVDLSNQSGRRSAERERRPVVAPHWLRCPVKRRRRQYALGKTAVLEIPGFLRPDWGTSRHQDEFIPRRKLHDFTRREKVPRRLLARDHEVAEPGRQPVAGVVLHRPQFGRDAERVRYALRGALVVGRETYAHMAVIEDRVVWAVGLLDLIERMGNQ